MSYIKLTHRTDPDLGIAQASGYILLGLLGVGLLGGCGVFGVSVLSGETRIDSFASLLQNLFVAVSLIFWAGLWMLMGLIGVSTLLKRRKWLKAAVSGQALIVHKSWVRSEDQYGVVTDHGYQFALKPDHLASVDVSEQLVWVVVNNRVYNQYAEGDVVRIYYLSTDPLEFLIQGE